MTATITLRPSSPAERAPRRRVSARTYRRRRAAVGIVSAVFVAVGMVGAFDLLAPGTPAGATAEHAPRTGPATVVARPGDTLWAIAAEYRGSVPIGEYVDALVDLNGGPAIEAGQSVRLP